MIRVCVVIWIIHSLGELVDWWKFWNVGELIVHSLCCFTFKSISHGLNILVNMTWKPRFISVISPLHLQKKIFKYNFEKVPFFSQSLRLILLLFVLWLIRYDALCKNRLRSEMNFYEAIVFIFVASHLVIYPHQLSKIKFFLSSTLAQWLRIATTMFWMLPFFAECQKTF